MVRPDPNSFRIFIQYDILGRVIISGKFATNSNPTDAYSGGSYGQSIDYTYNIRKWLTQINDPASCGADLFSEKLGYTDANASLSAIAKFNGNIAWVEWRTGANCTVGGVSRNKAGYGFIYDGLDRMTGSRYGENTGSWTNLNRYNENLTYDLNGNILTLGRRGYISSGNWNSIDTLTYTYSNSSNPNWATTIADGSGSALGYPNTSGTFSFDAAGNQTSYSAKSITAITYNHLNLPTKYTWSGGSTLEIQYDASGRKLKKIPSTGNAKTYVGGIEYSASTIEAIYHPEGRARLISSTWEYEYVIKDHLGNSRVYFKYNGSITFLQESHYYPFGMEQGGWTGPASPENKYKYNGKEYNDDFSLGLNNFGARWYDACMGRWSGLDQLSEKYESWSPYHFVYNNPLKYYDPNGLEIIIASSKGSDEYKVTESALNILRKTNPEAYARLEKSTVKYSISFSQLNPDNAYSSNYSGNFFNGHTTVNWDISYGLEVTEVMNDSKGNLGGGKLSRFYNGKEQDEMRDKGDNPNGKKKNISLEEAGNFISNSGVDIKLDVGLLKGSLKELTATLGHEFGHADYADRNPVMAFIWSIITKELGHDPNNPSGKAADTEEERTRKGFNKAKKLE